MKDVTNQREDALKIKRQRAKAGPRAHQPPAAALLSALGNARVQRLLRAAASQRQRDDDEKRDKPVEVAIRLAAPALPATVSVAKKPAKKRRASTARGKVQRFGTEEHSATEERAAAPAEEEERFTMDEWMGKIGKAKVFVSSPYIFFRIGDGAFAKPADEVQVRSGGGE